MIDEELLRGLEYMWTDRMDDFALVPIGKNEDGSLRYSIRDHSINHAVIIEDDELAQEVKRRMLSAGVYVGNPDAVDFRKALIRKRLGKL